MQLNFEHFNPFGPVGNRLAPLFIYFEILLWSSQAMQ